MSTNLMNPQSIRLAGNEGAQAAANHPTSMRFIAPLLNRIRGGCLRLEYPDGGTQVFGDNGAPVVLRLHDWRVLDSVMKSGDIGLAESYMDGLWDSDDLPKLLELLNRNRGAIEGVVYGSWWGGLLYRFRHFLNRNSKAGSRKNIHAHYDIGNDFYRLWLDPSMTYSSALFDGERTQSLEQAQQAKYRRVLEQLELQSGASILEIGCGWGGFAELAAREGGAHVTGLTLSHEQLEFAQKRLALAGVADNAALHLRDYRDVNGQYDAIASIEMFEAVGEAYWESYFDCIKRNLKVGGRACIQSIVIADALFARYRKRTDFIQQYIFPGGMLPSPAVFRQLAEGRGLRVVNELEFGLDYARTLAAWRARFHEQRSKVAALGFDERFLRTWDFYLAYCEAGFRAGSIDVMHFTLEKTC